MTTSTDPLASPEPIDPADRADPAGPSRAVLARRVIGFDEALHRRLVTSVARLPFGAARTTPELSRVFSLNAIDVDRAVALPELLEAVAQHMGGLPNQCVWTTRAEVAWSVGPGLAERGWILERVVYMVHDGSAPTVTPLNFSVTDAQGYAGLARAVVAEEPWGSGTAVQEEMQARNVRLAERMDARFVVSGDGMAGCHIYRHGTIAQIESVSVLAAARGQGLGAGLMAAALQAAGDAQTVFLIADADDWPRQWYARLGFQPVASGWEWNHKVSEI